MAFYCQYAYGAQRGNMTGRIDAEQTYFIKGIKIEQGFL
jgi:hypothetical protein